MGCNSYTSVPVGFGFSSTCINAFPTLHHYSGLSLSLNRHLAGRASRKALSERFYVKNKTYVTTAMRLHALGFTALTSSAVTRSQGSRAVALTRTPTLVSTYMIFTGYPTRRYPGMVMGWFHTQCVPVCTPGRCLGIRSPTPRARRTLRPHYSEPPVPSSEEHRPGEEVKDLSKPRQVFPVTHDETTAPARYLEDQG